jgi:hypothetical protein
MKYVTGFFHFWYDFLIGDSWQIALGVVLVLIATRLLIVAVPSLAGVIGPAFFLALLAVFSGALLNEQRGSNRRG